MKVKKYILLAIASLSLVGCADLDTEPQGSVVTAAQEAQVYANAPEKVVARVNGIFSSFKEYMKGYTAGSTHCDFGYPSVMMFTDSRGMDLVSEDIGYNWFSYGLDLTDRVFTNYQNKTIWSTMYNQVYACNYLFTVLDKISEDDLTRFYLAQAYAVRAFDYFTLAQLYQFTYVDSKDKPCVPIITEENMYTGAETGVARASVDSVYSYILSNLDSAIELLDSCETTSSNKGYVNALTCRAIRARVYLTMQEWDKAAKDAEYVINSAQYAPLSIAEASQPGFTDINAKNWIWGIDVLETDRVVTSGLVNFPSHMCSLSYGYASVGAYRCINKALYNKIGVNDARKGWFLDADSKSTNLTDEQASYVAKNKIPAYANVKFAPYEGKLYQSTNASDIPLIRIEEMYLILAEAQAMAGKPATGAETLTNFVKAYRDASYTCKATTATEVQDAVWFQRRVEFWGEGLSYFDIMRLKKGIDRRGAGFEEQFVYVIEPTNDVLTYQIPNAEIEANPLISQSDNNPTAPKPDPVKDEE